MDTSTPQGRTKRLYEMVEGYKKTNSIRALVRLIGGNPKADLGDYSDADAVNEPRQREDD